MLENIIILYNKFDLINKNMELKMIGGALKGLESHELLSCRVILGSSRDTEDI